MLAAWGVVPPIGTFGTVVARAIADLELGLDARNTLRRAQALWGMWRDVTSRKKQDHVRQLVQPLGSQLELRGRDVFREIPRVLLSANIAELRAISDCIGSEVDLEARRLRSQARQRYHRVAGVDVGHLLSHVGGGPADINFVHQDRALNRGWSPDGRAFRALERFSTAQVGAMRFALASYRGAEVTPTWITIGIVLGRENLIEPPSMHSAVRVITLRDGSGVVLVGVFDNRQAVAAVDGRATVTGGVSTN